MKDLSSALKREADEAFSAGYDMVGTMMARLAADARELEYRVQVAEIRAALMSEEG